MYGLKRSHTFHPHSSSTSYATPSKQQHILRITMKGKRQSRSGPDESDKVFSLCGTKVITGDSGTLPGDNRIKDAASMKHRTKPMRKDSLLSLPAISTMSSASFDQPYLSHHGHGGLTMQVMINKNIHSCSSVFFLTK